MSYGAIRNYFTAITSYNKINDIVLNTSKFGIKNAVRSSPNRIEKMKDAMEQLEGKLNEINLRGEFLEYVGLFNYLPRQIIE
ncbi:MAG TPA: hypothetical protein VE594_01660 [Nitrososphaeraceae archaeon]|nr:hypothetical protein [Nitrososphaeraceae archaeon]